MQAADLHSLELCSMGCHQIVNRPALWQSLLVQRFGQLTADQLSQTTTHLSVLELKQKYVQLSRQIIPASEMQVLLRRQWCIWRCLFSRSARNIYTVFCIQAVHLAKANTHTDPQYLVHKAMARSTFGTVLFLRSVCWLDISASFQV